MNNVEREKLLEQFLGEWYSVEQNKVYTFVSANKRVFIETLNQPDKTEASNWILNNPQKGEPRPFAFITNLLNHKLEFHFEEYPYKARISHPQGQDIWLVKDAHK